MEFYWILFIIICIGSFEGFKLKNESLIYHFIVFLIVLFAGCRGNGYDWLSYQEIYENLQNGGEQSGVSFVEYGFQILCTISPFYKCLIFIAAAISISYTLNNTYYFSKKYFPVLGLLIFCTTVLLSTYMGQIRQGIAIGFICKAIRYNYLGKTKLTIVWIITACFFHISAILSLLIFFLPRKRLSIKTYIVIMLIALIFHTTCMTILESIISHFQVGIVQKLMYYSVYEDFDLGVSSTILIRIVTLILAIYLNKNNDKNITYICNIYLCGILIYLIFGFLPQLGGRGALYFSIYEIVLVPYIVYKLRKRAFVCISTFFIIIGLSILRFYSFFSDPFNYSSYIPYLLY